MKQKSWIDYVTWGNKRSEMKIKTSIGKEKKNNKFRWLNLKAKLNDSRLRKQMEIIYLKLELK